MVRPVTDLAEVCAAVAYAVPPFAFRLDAPSRASPAVFLRFDLSAHAAAAKKFGRGLIGGVELVLLFVLAGVMPVWFGLIAYVGGALCFVAAGVEASRRI